MGVWKYSLKFKVSVVISPQNKLAILVHMVSEMTPLQDLIDQKYMKTPRIELCFKKWRRSGRLENLLILRQFSW